jgi:hypothetical protein
MGLINPPLSKKRTFHERSTYLPTLIGVILLTSFTVLYGIARWSPIYTSKLKWDIEDFKSLVTFGDSYTDESRALYFFSHGGHPPPPGWVAPIVSSTSVYPIIHNCLSALFLITI